MAAIDKIYIKGWKSFCLFKEWVSEQPPIEDKYGNKVKLSSYLFEWKEETWSEDKTHPVMNNPYYIDAYIIKNCPLDFIQEQLKDMYGNDYELIKTGKLYSTPYSQKTYIAGKHLKCIKKPNIKYNRPIKGNWWINVKDNFKPPYIVFHRHYDGKLEGRITMDWTDEFVDTVSISACTAKTIKSAIRQIIKFRLPVGTHITITGRYTNELYEFIVIL